MKKQLILSLIFLLSVFSNSYGEWEDSGMTRKEDVFQE